MLVPTVTAATPSQNATRCSYVTPRADTLFGRSFGPLAPDEAPVRRSAATLIFVDHPSVVPRSARGSGRGRRQELRHLRRQHHVAGDFELAVMNARWDRADPRRR